MIPSPEPDFFHRFLFGEGGGLKSDSFSAKQKDTCKTADAWSLASSSFRQSQGIAPLLHLLFI